MPATARQVASECIEAAEGLQTAIVALGTAYKRFSALANEYRAATGHDLSARLGVPISMHLSQAGFTALLDRKLQGAPADLADIVDQQLQRH